jgi:heme-degrading monooxygenase HmoA
MYARVARYEARPEHVEDGIRRFRDGTEAVRQMAGFKKAYLLVDRRSGKALTVTLWETEDNMRASDAAARQIRSEGAQAMGGTVSEPELYEVGLEL